MLGARVCFASHTPNVKCLVFARLCMCLPKLCPQVLVALSRHSHRRLTHPMALPVSLLGARYLHRPCEEYVHHGRGIGLNSQPPFICQFSTCSTSGLIAYGVIAFGLIAFVFPRTSLVLVASWFVQGYWIDQVRTSTLIETGMTNFLMDTVLTKYRILD